MTITALASAAASTGSAAHADPIAQVVIYLAVILVSARLGGEVASRLRQPAVLGELIAGVLLGNLGLIGVDVFEPMKSDAAIDVLARLGVLMLLFQVGLESTVGQMLKVGLSALLVAVVGVVVPFGLGWLVGRLLLPAEGFYVHAFLGATLCATSVGITARVLKDLGRAQSETARVILGAAVIDDVLGLIVLAVVSGVIQAANLGGRVSIADLAGVVGKASGFLVGSMVLGVLLAPRLFRIASRLQTGGVLLAVGLAFCFCLSWLADVVGLAPIVGAFAAGLILEDVHYTDFVSRGEHGLEELIAPISSFLVPVFFVVMGMRTDVRAFLRPEILGLAAALTLAAITGKQVCGLGALGGRVDRLSIGIGMIPRGEVGLIFANIGLALHIDGHPVIGSGTFSAVVVMVILTTLVTPPALKWSMERAERRGAEQARR